MQYKTMTALAAVATVIAHPIRALLATAKPKLTLTAQTLPTVPAMPRSIVAAGVRADGDVTTLIRTLNGAFEEFKTTHAREMDEIKAGKTDVLTKDKLDAINAALSELQTAVDDQAKFQAAAKLGNGAVIGDIKGDPEYVAAFKAHSWYNVGENGTERFVPDGNGTILPNGAIKSAPLRIALDVSETPLLHVRMRETANTQATAVTLDRQRRDAKAYRNTMGSGRR